MNDEVTPKTAPASAPDDFLRQLMQAAQADETEIHAAANAPYLWQKVRTQLHETQQPRRRTNLRTIGWRQFLQRPQLAFGAALLLFALAFFAWQARKNTAPDQIAQVPVPTVIEIVPRPTTTPANQATSAAEKPSKRAKSAPINTAPARPMLRQTKSTPEVKTTSEFIPLTYDASARTQGGQIVRVEIPRSTLLALGLPLAGEPTREQMQADVLLNDEGLALAIRLVR